MSEPEAESRDSAPAAPRESQPAGASTMGQQKGGEDVSPPQIRKGSGIPPISPRTVKERSSSMKGLLGHHHSNHQHLGGSPRFPRRDRSLSLGQYPYSGSHSSSSSSLFMPPPPYSPVMSSSPVVTPTAAASTYNEMPPFMPNLSPHGPTRAAMESAIQSERLRAKEKEKEESDMTADELKVVLKRERTRMAKIAADLAALRSAAVQSQAEAEVHEEGRINHLMRRLDCLQQEKGRIIMELEREEELLTNTLQKKLDEVKREKMLLEQQIEREQKSHKDLQTNLTSIRDAKAEAKGQSEESTISESTIPEHPDSIPEGDEEPEEGDEESDSVQDTQKNE